MERDTPGEASAKLRLGAALDDLLEVMQTHGTTIVPHHVTIWRDIRARQKEDTKLSVMRWRQCMLSTSATKKAELPLFSPAIFGDDRSDSRSLRTDRNVLATTGAVIDLDTWPCQALPPAAIMAAAGILSIVYTTPSHTTLAPKWRVVCFTSVPLPPGEHRKLVGRVVGVLIRGAKRDGEIVVDRVSFSLSHSFYFGSVIGTTSYFVSVVPGVHIDKACYLDAGALAEDGQAFGLARPLGMDSEGTNDPWTMRDVDLDRVQSALDAFPVCAVAERTIWFSVGAAIHSVFDGQQEGREVWDRWSGRAPNFDQSNDQQLTWNQFRNDREHGVGAGTIFHLAKAYGWSAPEGEASKETDLENTSALTLLTPSQCEQSTARSYLVKGFISAGDVGCVFGVPGAGKSLIAPLIAYKVAQGEAVFGLRTKQGSVFYIASEDSAGMRGRIRALKNEHGDAPAFRLVEGVSDLLSNDGQLDAVMALVEAHKPAMVIIDTVAMAFPNLEENDAQSMGRVVAAARRLASGGSSVIIVHHSPKDESAAVSPRGHSVLNGALDVALHLKTKDEAGIIRGRLTKNRNGSTDHRFDFRIAVATFGLDDDGDPVGAAFAEVVEDAPVCRARSLGKPERGALMILDRLLAEGGDGNPQVLIRGWRAAAIEGVEVSGAESKDSRRKAFDRVIRVLVQSGAVVQSEDGNYVSRAQELSSEVNRPVAIATIFEDGR